MTKSWITNTRRFVSFPVRGHHARVVLTLNLDIIPGQYPLAAPLATRLADSMFSIACCSHVRQFHVEGLGRGTLVV